ncbi:MAG: hypothetical protein ACO1OB_02955 [Archangium sp.]
MTSLLVAMVMAQAATVDLHVVEERVAKQGRFEVSLFPAAAQLNGQYTQHVGTFGAVTYHLRERFGLQLLGGGNWYNAESAFNSELVEKFRIEAQAAQSLLWTWGVFAGVEVEPLTIKFAVFDDTLVHAGLVIGGAAGAGGTRHQLKPGNSTSATYGDTGVRFMGNLSAGFRVQVGKHFTARLDVRDVIYSGQMTTVNGCTAAQIPDFRGEPVASCGNFETTTDATIARNLLLLSSSAILNNVGLYVGAGFVF